MYRWQLKNGMYTTLKESESSIVPWNVDSIIPKTAVVRRFIGKNESLMYVCVCNSIHVYVGGAIKT